MNPAEEYLIEHLTPLLSRDDLSFIHMEEMKKQPEWAACITAIKQAQLEAIDEAVKRCAESAETCLDSANNTMIDIDSIILVSEQLRKEIK